MRLEASYLTIPKNMHLYNGSTHPQTCQSLFNLPLDNVFCPTLLAIWLTVIFGGGFVAINLLFAVWAFNINCPGLFANHRDMPLNCGARWWTPWPRPLGSETGCHEAHTVSYEIRGICKKLGGLQKSWAMNITEGSYTVICVNTHIHTYSIWSAMNCNLYVGNTAGPPRVLGP